jgi:hypothetical protein
LQLKFVFVNCYGTRYLNHTFSFLPINRLFYCFSSQFLCRLNYVLKLFR